MSREYERSPHRVHLVLYHLIWCPKRRKPVLTGAVATRLCEVIGEVAAEHGWTVENLTVKPDHLHLFVRGEPTVAAHEMVRLFKGRASRVLRQEFPSLLRLPSLWTRSYFCSTAGNVSAEAIERYIEAQKGQ